ncbi:hypothetical protein [Marinobacter sp.]|uniref:hypothetical protein n=1 Tax=Marinobacter sp. TaxID=50741 RepID=UPI0023559AB2|nr:hypothetical protein [Marinobacter sp.]
MSQQATQEVIDAVYSSPLNNNPNLTYGSVLSPMEVKILAIARDENTRNREIQAGNLDAETYNRILQAVPVIEEKLKTYNIAPISYTLEEREPETFAAMQRDQEEAQQRQTEAGVRGNFPQGYVPFVTKEPIGFKKRQRIASYGIDPDNPYEFEDRTKEREFYNLLVYGPRKLSKENVQYVLDKSDIKGDLLYIDPSKPDLGFRFKPEGSDQYQILRNPRLTRDDIRKFVRQESPAIVGDILGIGTAAVTTRGAGLGSTSLGNAFKNILVNTAGSTAGAVGGDVARLIYGKQQGYNDLSIEEIVDEAQLMGLYAGIGTAAVNTAMKVVPAFYRALSGELIPADVLAKIQAVVDRQGAVLQRKGAEQTIYGVDVATVDEINDQIRYFVKEAGEEYKGYNPSLAGANPLDQDAADLEFIWLKLAKDPNLSGLYGEMKSGNQSVINLLMRELGKEFEGKPLKDMPVGTDVDEAVRASAQEQIDRYVTEGSAAINRILREADESIPTSNTTLFDKTAKGDADILPKTTSNLAAVRDNYLKDYQDNFNKILNDPRYAEFSTGAGFTKNIAKEFKTLRDNTTRQFKRPEVVKEIEQTLGLGNKQKTLLYRLAGQSPDGSAVFKSPDFTLRELFELQIVLNELRVNSKIQRSRVFAREAIENINKQIDKSFNDEVAKRLGITVRTNYGKKDLDKIEEYKRVNNFGNDLTLAYREMDQAYTDVNNQVLKQLIANERPEELIPALLNTNVPNARINTPVTDFIKVLESGGNDGVFYVQKQMLDYIQNTVIKPDNTPLQNNKAVKDFINKNKGTLDAIFKDDFGTFINKNQLDRVGRKVAEQDRQINILRNTFGVDTDSVNPVYDIVNNIIRAAPDVRSSGQLQNDIDFLMTTIGDNPILEDQVAALTRNILLRDFLGLRKGAGGQFEINPQALNSILNEGFGPDELAGKLTFEESFGKLLGKDSADNIKAFKLLNDLVQREVGLDPSEGLSLAMVNVDQAKAVPGFKLLQRMLIPPLTQTGRRVTALDLLMNTRSEDFIRQVIRDPKLARQVVRAAEGRVSIQQFANFLSAYNNVYIQDIGNELQYYDTKLKELKINQKEELTLEDEQAILDVVTEYMNNRRK